MCAIISWIVCLFMFYCSLDSPLGSKSCQFWNRMLLGSADKVDFNSKVANICSITFQFEQQNISAAKVVSFSWKTMCSLCARLSLPASFLQCQPKAYIKLRFVYFNKKNNLFKYSCIMGAKVCSFVMHIIRFSSTFV